MVKILLKRIYEEPSEADGYRILLDRLWPRGLKKEDAKFDEWRKDITPSKELRQWFHEDKDRHWEVFQGRYGMEIKQNPDFIPFLREIEKHPVVTFLTAAKDVQHSHLPILKEPRRLLTHAVRQTAASLCNSPVRHQRYGFLPA